MKSFEYVITDPNGIHARPAGALVNFAKKYDDDIKISKDGKTADAKRLLSVMSLGIKYDDKIKVDICGETEQRTMDDLWNFFGSNL